MCQKEKPVEELSVDELQPLAEKGCVDAQRELGHVYRFGKRGAAIDEFKAYIWYRVAEENGDVAARFILRQCFDSSRCWIENQLCFAEEEVTRRLKVIED